MIVASSDRSAQLDFACLTRSQLRTVAFHLWIYCAQTHLGANKAPCIGVLDHAYRVFDDAYRASKQRKDFSNGFHPCGGIGKFVVDERVVDRRIDEPWADSMKAKRLHS